MGTRRRRGGAAASPRRKKEARKPRWLLTTKDLDLIAQRRCLMILSVLSGEKSVEEASRDADIIPALYYQLEKKALTAMLAALVPGATRDGSPGPAMVQMEKRIRDLETTKRRLERLLFLTRMTVKPGPMTHGRRGRPRTRQEEAGTTKSTSTSTRPKTKPTKAPAASTLTPAGEGAS
jgi:hypothetical protein